MFDSPENVRNLLHMNQVLDLFGADIPQIQFDICDHQTWAAVCL